MAPDKAPVTSVEATAWIDAYLGDLPADQRTALQELRDQIAAAAPEAVETISYGLPAFRYGGRPLVSYHAAKAHCSLFPMGPGIMEAHAAELAGFDHSKGTIRFTPDHRLPPELVAAIVRERVVQVDAARARPRRRPGGSESP